MNRFVFVFLSVTCVFTGTFVSSVERAVSSVENSDYLIRLPLVPRSRRAADANGLTTIPVKSNRDVNYGIPVEIGTPPQKFSLLLDSGSTDIWVVSKSSKIRDATQPSFDETASSTYQKISDDFALSYIGDSASGLVGSETFSIAGLSVKNQPFGLVNNTPVDPVPFDGLIGISYPLAGAHDNSTIIDRLFEQGQIKKRVSCVKLRASYKQETSEYIIGGCDVENVSWVPVVQIDGQYTGWRVNLTKVILRSTSDNSELLTLDTNNLAVMDTGASSIIGVPDKFLDPILAKMVTTFKGNHYVVDCKNRSSLPVMEFYFGDAMVPVTYDYYSWEYNGDCQLGLNRGDWTSFLFGSFFFNEATVIFDRDNNRIGLAPK